jgi:hypothetical protein
VPVIAFIDLFLKQLLGEGISFGIIRASKNSWNQGLIDLL